MPSLSVITRISITDIYLTPVVDWAAVVVAALTLVFAVLMAVPMVEPDYRLN